jgi:class III poly(R)-hydroxyalkanoic acid synthase PhaE subunit
MEKPFDETFALGPMLETWLKSAQTLWEPMLKQWMSPPADEAGADTDGQAKWTHQRRRSLQTAMKTWQAIYNVMSQSENLDAQLQGINAIPDIAMQIVQSVWDGIFQTQKQWMEKGSIIGEKSGSFTWDDFDQEAFKVWQDIYEKEIQQFYRIPQLGLTRLYQERVSDSMDKFNQFQASMAEFLHVIMAPVEKSFVTLQDKIQELAEGDELPDNAKDYYNMWIKVLEGHYMTLYKTPEYTRSLAGVLTKYESYKTARDEVLQDALSLLPIPTQKEMDELYKEIYHLKRRIQELERQNRSK